MTNRVKSPAFSEEPTRPRGVSQIPDTFRRDTREITSLQRGAVAQISRTTTSYSTEEIDPDLLEKKLKEAERQSEIDAFFDETNEIPLISTNHPNTFRRDSSPVFLAVDSKITKYAPSITQEIPRVDLQSLLSQDHDSPIPAGLLPLMSPTLEEDFFTVSEEPASEDDDFIEIK